MQLEVLVILVFLGIRRENFKSTQLLTVLTDNRVSILSELEILLSKNTSISLRHKNSTEIPRLSYLSILNQCLHYYGGALHVKIMSPLEYKARFPKNHQQKMTKISSEDY